MSKLCTAILDFCPDCGPTWGSGEYVVCGLENKHESKDHTTTGEMKAYGHSFKYIFTWKHDDGEDMLPSQIEQIIQMAREQQAGETASE